MRSVDELERRVLRAIRDDFNVFEDIRSRVNADLVWPPRQVDRALQRLRKRGEITYTRSAGWRLANEVTQ